MATPDELLALAKKIAVKARQLIPRSQNRAIFDDPVDDRAVDSQWAKKDIPTYLSMQIAAQRSRSSQNQYRWLVDSVVKDVGMHSTATEKELDKAFKARLRTLGVSESTLHSAFATERSKKKAHKNKAQVLPMEMQEQAAKNAVRYRVGNCGENASLAYVMFAEYPGPKGEMTLPALDIDPDQRPWVEKIAATPKGDHAFVVVNRPQGDPTDIATWLDKGNVIICDPWWFHTGEALKTNDRTTSDKRDLLDFITSWKNYLKVVGPAVRLGCGHSDRFRGKTKYGGLNYYENTVEATVGFLRRAEWQPDSATTRCPICNVVFFSGTFSLSPRKHHCRKCGRVVCDTCSQGRKIVPFPATSDESVPSVSTGPVRVCNACV
jgi:hypothetical protein